MTNETLTEQKPYPIKNYNTTAPIVTCPVEVAGLPFK